MVERNMIREGFIRNTPTSPTNPTFSGSQIVNESQQHALADENLSVPAVTVSATENIDLTADLGARWKLDRIELYTDDPSANNVTMEISDNNVEYYEVTMTGSPNLYVGDISDSTVSGTPRYIRYRHAATSALNVFEWRAINDDSIVDFGSDGNLNEVEIADAPIGRPSDTVTKLELFNRYHKAGNASVFIENNPSSLGDDQIEIALSPVGPWFGRQLVSGRQPEITLFSEGTTAGTQIVTSSGYFVNWNIATSLSYGWVADGGVLDSPSFNTDGIKLKSNLNTSPGLSNFGLFTGITDPNLGGNSSAAGPTNPNIHPNRIAFRPDLYNKVRVRLVGPQIPPTDLVEGPRLFWRGIDDADTTSWSLGNSIPSNFGSFTGQSQDFVFDVGNVATWSGAGAIRGLRIQPFTTSSGLDLLTEIQEIEVYHSSGLERVVLSENPTISGIRPNFDFPNNSTSVRVILSLNTRFTQPCLVTKVVASSAIGSANLSGIFLARFTSTDPGFNFPNSPGNNFQVKNIVRFQGDTKSPSILQAYVNWKAEPGDFLGWTRETDNSLVLYYRDSAEAGYGSAYTATPASAITLNSASDTQSDLNISSSSWSRIDNRVYSIWAETISAGTYITTGTYTTPIFDAGTVPGLMSASFISFEPEDSSIDSNISEAFATLKVRASDYPPLTSPSIGDSVSHSSYAGPNIPTWLNEDRSNAGNDWMLNHTNGFVTTREALANQSVHNVGAAMLYHQEKDELWVMNVLISGTIPNDARPIWDVYDPDTFLYKRTMNVQGPISYSSLTNDINGNTESFEPFGFVADWENEEIYIIQRDSTFFINTGTYYAVVTDLEGNFKRASFRSDAMGSTPVAFWNNALSATFDGKYFYILTDDTTNPSPSRGSHVMVVRRGTSSDPTAITVVDSFTLGDVPGLTTVLDNNPNGQQLIYSNGLLYVLYANPISGADNPAARVHEIHALSITFNSDDTINSVSKVDIGPYNGGSRISGLDTIRDGFTGDWADLGDPTSLIRNRELKHDTSMIYDNQRNCFTVLQTRTSLWGDEYNARTNQRIIDTHIYANKSHSFLFSFSAGTSPIYGNTPALPASSDPLWGVLSGTLSYEPIQKGSVLFPPGRYGQLQYVLNSNSDRRLTPQLLESQIDQGLNVGTIPSSGTVSIYLRTNIPENQPIGDLQGNLKVFWELPE